MTQVKLNTIYPGDCADLLAKLPDNSVDLIVSSPPYNIGKAYESKVVLKNYMALQGKILQQCARVLKDTGSLFWQVGAYSNAGVLIPLDVRFFPLLEDLGMIPRNRIIWIRTHGLHASKKFSSRHESILWFTKTMDYKFDLDSVRVPQKYQNKKAHRGANKGELTCNPDGKNPADVWLFRNVKHNHEEQTIHPCQFPEDMIARIVQATTAKGDVILDPYMGTGTVAVVAKELGRKYLGAETDPRYLEVAQRRLSGLPNEKGSFANLKCLRDYVERTGSSISRFRFDVQVGKTATTRDLAKIYPEEHHLEEFERRLSYEEDAFSAKLRGTEIAPDINLNGAASPKLRPRIDKRAARAVGTLFGD